MNFNRKEYSIILIQYIQLIKNSNFNDLMINKFLIEDNQKYLTYESSEIVINLQNKS